MTGSNGAGLAMVLLVAVHGAGVHAMADYEFPFDVRGRVQPRYEYERRDGQADHSSFFIRRARLDFRGHAHGRALTWRIMPELARTATLRDAWLDYAFSDAVRIRFGQYSVPFNWARDSSSSRHQFIERPVANNDFQWNDGRDIGVMLHGDIGERVRYGIGAFGGEGGNVRRTGSNGNLFAGRVTFAPVGSYPSSEALVQRVDGANVAFGLGAGINRKHTTADWQDADVTGLAADAHYQAGPFSAQLAGYYRDVDPRASAAFDGNGYTAQAGMLIVPGRIFGGLRYSRSEPDGDVPAGAGRELLAGLQVYHDGHGAKVHLEAGRLRRHDGAGWRDTRLVRVQYQLLF